MPMYDTEEYMTGAEIVNLIEKLEEEGMSSDKIIEIIKYVETNDPRNPKPKKVNKTKKKQ
ncbi:MAG: hypothetical protein IK016_08060 [Lachnospiraceae bacterium]|nr:hypothetical protein [Lachnospiraceae bacterium]